MIIGKLALISAAFFTGAALYVMVAEQYARLKLNQEAALSEWQFSLERGFMMQATLATVAGLLGLLSFFGHFNWYWILGAICILANWPYTMYVMLPVNNELKTGVLEDPKQTLTKWGNLHIVRIVLGAVATFFFMLPL